MTSTEIRIQLTKARDTAEASHLHYGDSYGLQQYCKGKVNAYTHALELLAQLETAEQLDLFT